jgi:outer membrane receptor for ferrienterochelin and colicin
MEQFDSIKIIILTIVLQGLIFAGQTGKISGRITDSATGDPLPGANVIIKGTVLGAAADIEGDYFILNVPPGIYSLRTSMIGYTPMVRTQVRISVDQTVRVDFTLASTVLEGEVVTVTAIQPLIQQDLTATSSTVSAAEIADMPVESFQDILQLQAGVVEGANGELHMRGGRSSEIAYMVDGMSVTDPYSGQMAVDVDQGAIQEMKVISGTFNAEYGKVMSGVVEIVTKDPGDSLKAGGSFYAGDYISGDNDLYPNIDEVNPLSVNNVLVYLNGPVPGVNNLGFYLSLRRFANEGWYYGQRRYSPSDSSDFQNANAVYIEQTGDGEFVPMNDSEQLYANAKLVWRPMPALKIAYSFLGDRSNYNAYNHIYKYNPDGDISMYQTGYTHIVSMNHMLSPSTFYTVKMSRYEFNYKEYLYEDVDDSRYVNPVLLRNRADAFSFYTGGTDMRHHRRTTTVDVIKADLTSQVNKWHQIKIGAEYKSNALHSDTREANYRGVEGGGLYSAGVFFNRGEYIHKPVEMAAYLQDKIELNNMTVNLGLRYDYFDSNGLVPLDDADPGNDREAENAYTDAKVKHQFSPRIGLAFPVSVTGVFHASYGHFFQIPTFEQLYLNPRFAVAPGGLGTLMGNTDLKPQSTVIYEIGFQQAFLDIIGVDVTGFYKDVRNLLGTEIIETYISGTRYARYVNRDYGNIRGITLAVTKRLTPEDHLTLSFDYTFQVSEGNASDPNHEFNNNQSDPPKKSNIQVVPLDWDQRHTINLAVTWHDKKYLGIGLIGRFQSGLPYTPALQNQEQSFENSGRKPMNINIDLRLFRKIKVGKISLNTFVKVYNLFDLRNELNVYTDTGRAGYSLVSQYVAQRNEWVNTLSDWLSRPEYYSEPRKVLAGFDIEL